MALGELRLAQLSLEEERMEDVYRLLGQVMASPLRTPQQQQEYSVIRTNAQLLYEHIHSELN